MPMRPTGTENGVFDDINVDAVTRDDADKVIICSSTMPHMVDGGCSSLYLIYGHLIFRGIISV